MTRIKWTFEKIKEEALKYQTRSEFQKFSPAYQAARKRNIVDEVCKHMEVHHKEWSMASLKLEASKYRSRNLFAIKHSKAYSAAQRKGILDEVCKHMESSYNKWTIESIYQEALKYNSRVEFKNKSHAYQAALRHGIIREVCDHMKSTLVNWTPEVVRAEALKYNSRYIFFKKNPNAYAAICRMGILDQVCSHMLPATNTSLSEKDLFIKIKNIYPKTQKLSDRKVNIPDKPHIKGFDIDIYIPELKKGIEFDGKYFHSLEGLKRGRPNWPKEDLENYHKIKDQYFLSKGMEILHIKEEDWMADKEKCIKKCMEFLK